MTENYANFLQEQAITLEALQWYIDNGVDEAIMDIPVDRTVVPDIKETLAKLPVAKKTPVELANTGHDTLMGTHEAIMEAVKLAEASQNLDELKNSITKFDGLSIKQTAKNMVFADGNPQSPIMLIGEAPSADDDLQGKAFCGQEGQLLDKILACIDLGRDVPDIKQSVYLTNVLNWRPPGNRTPTQGEMDISRAFIERHIALVQPKMLIICGGGAAKTLLKSSETISKLRGKFHNYDMGSAQIPTIVTYHPVYLINTPLQKKAVWADMLMFQAKKNELFQ